MSDAITLTIKSSGDVKYEVSISPSNTVLELKEAIASKSEIPATTQRLIYSGKVLKDTETVQSYKIQTGHTIHLVKSAAKTSNPNSSTTIGASNSSTPTGTGTGAAGTAGNNSAVPANISAGQGAFNPLADLTGARYAGYTQLPSASMFGPDGGMNGVTPDPEQLSQMMSNPMFQESMNSLLSNPQMLDYLIEQNPQLRAMGPQARQMLQSPFFRQMISNPEMMRSMMDMGRNFGGDANTAFPSPGANPTISGSTEGTETNTEATTGGTAANQLPNPFSSFFGGNNGQIDPFALFGGAPQQPVETDNRPPEERYASQLSQLNDMGFFDFDRNVAALRRSGGNVQGAVEYLLSE